MTTKVTEVPKFPNDTTATAKPIKTWRRRRPMTCNISDEVDVDPASTVLGGSHALFLYRPFCLIMVFISSLRFIFETLQHFIDGWNAVSVFRFLLFLYIHILFWLCGKSLSHELNFGIPQGSMPGPVLYLLYTSPTIDLHPSKPLISLVPITCTTYCFQG